MERENELRAWLPYKNVTIGLASDRGHQPNGERIQYNVCISKKINVLDRDEWNECRRFHCSVARALYDYVFVEKRHEIEKLLF